MADRREPELPFTGALFKSATETGNDWHFNACVGHNTGSNENSFGYSSGFEMATEVMLASLGVPTPPGASGDWGANPLVDLLVYPICYSARHHVELVVKRMLTKAWKAFRLRSPNDSHGLIEPGSAIDHSVQLFWQQLHEICSKTDSRLRLLTEALDPYIQDIELIDSSGQAFRYASDARSSRRHLSAVSHIDLIHFAAGYKEMCHLLDELEYALMDVTSELETGTFTSKLTRDQLLHIAERLPQRSEWISEEFQRAKQEIILTYGLSSNDFQKACNQITSVRALACKVGIEMPIEHLNRDVFERLLLAFGGDRAASGSLTDDERSALFAVLEVGAHFVYPEMFESFLMLRPSSEHAAAHYDAEWDAQHLARRYARAPDVIERSLASLGQAELLAAFRDVYSDQIQRQKKSRQDHSIHA